MKYLLIFLLSLAGVSLAQVQCDPEISKQCPPEDGEYPEFLADPEDCAAYCECSGGTAWHFLCAPDTLFDESAKACNWADLVDCGNRPRPTAQSFVDN